MPVCHASLNTVPQVTSDAAWTVSKNKRFRANIIVWGMPKSLSTLEIRTKLADLGLVGFARGAVAWEGDHVRLGINYNIRHLHVTFTQRLRNLRAMLTQ